jgi:hypothetical protein
MVDKCHEYHSIDLAWLGRRKLLHESRWSSISWSRAGHVTGSIRFAAVPGGVMLSYRHRRHGGDWEDVRELVPLVETPTRFGGRRQWFQCLKCRRRCRILYGGAYFRCRRCHGLKYDTQYEPAFARAATRALKIRHRLGSTGGIYGPFPEKPKGMRWSTYERLREQDQRLQTAWAAGILQRWRVPS